MAQVNVELSNPSSSNISLNQTAVRALAQIPSGTISMDDLRGASSAMSATGGTVYTGPNYKLHAFTSPGTFEVTNVGPGSIEYVVIGGGGGGGGTGNTYSGPGVSTRVSEALHMGGGGAGGYRSGTATVYADTYPVIVGSKGSTQVNGNTSGGNSGFDNYYATGGGAGGKVADAQLCVNSLNNGTPGGSGGGGHCALRAPVPCPPYCSLPPLYTPPVCYGGCGPVPNPPICFQIPPSHPQYPSLSCHPNTDTPSPGGSGNAGQYSPVEGYNGASSTPSSNTGGYPRTTVGCGGGGAGQAGNANGEGGDGVVAPSRFQDQLTTDTSGYVAGGGSSALPYPGDRPNSIKAAGSYSWGGGRWCHPAGDSSNPSNESGHNGIVVISYPI